MVPLRGGGVRKRGFAVLGLFSVGLSVKGSKFVRFAVSRRKFGVGDLPFFGRFIGVTQRILAVFGVGKFRF